MRQKVINQMSLHDRNRINFQLFFEIGIFSDDFLVVGADERSRKTLLDRTKKTVVCIQFNNSIWIEMARAKCAAAFTRLVNARCVTTDASVVIIYSSHCVSRLNAFRHPLGGRIRCTKSS